MGAERSSSTTVPKQSPAAAETSKWIVAGTVLTGTFMAVLDSSIVNVALPSIQSSLGVTVEEITWVVTGYILAQVILMPITALLSERFGRKNFYLLSVVVFTSASMLSGIARTLPAMVVFRILQGAGGGVLITASQAILRESFPPAEQGLAMGLYGMGVVVAPAAGPVLGGWLTDQYSWPWIFYINVPIGVLNVLLVTRFIEDPPYLIRRKGKIDWAGLALLAVGLGALQLMLEQGERHDWFDSSFVTVLAVIAAVGLCLFAWVELTTDRPAVNLRILRNVSFTSATLLGAVLGLGLYGSLFLIPLFLQNLLGYTALKTGAVVMPRGLVMAVIMPLGGLLYNRIGPKALVGAGLVVCAYAFWGLAHLTGSSGFWDIVWPSLWQGTGFALIFVALSTAALSTIPRARMTQATGLYNVVRQVFGSIGIALVATMLARTTGRNQALLGQHVTSFDEATRRFLSRTTSAMIANGADAGTARRQAYEILDLRILRQAAVLAYNHVFMLVAVLFLLAAPLLLLLKGGHEHVSSDFGAE